MDELEQVLPEFSITIYTTADCSKCRMLKDILKNKSIDFIEKDAINFEDEVKELGINTAPIIVVTKDDINCPYDMDGFCKRLSDENIL